MPPDPDVVVGVGAIVERDGHLLMLRRGGTQWYADGYGTWSVPGGWLEKGETHGAAAAREVFEETGVHVLPVDTADYTVNANHAGSLWIVTLFVRCDYKGGEPRVVEPDKCPEVRWVPSAEVDNLPLFTPLRTWRARQVASAA